MNAQQTLSEIQNRGVLVTLEYRSETGTGGVRIVPRIALCGGTRRPGDFERLTRYKTAVVALLVASGAVSHAPESDGAEGAFGYTKVCESNRLKMNGTRRTKMGVMA